jgi:hypothetical protein
METLKNKSSLSKVHVSVGWFFLLKEPLNLLVLTLHFFLLGSMGVDLSLVLYNFKPCNSNFGTFIQIQ